MNEEVLILVDDRIGAASQAIGLAEELDLSYKIINLKYNFLINLPNFILGNLALGVKNKAQLKIAPKLVISAGRRAATAALFVKKFSQNKSKIIQIMNPNMDFKKFDLVILPKHDRAAGVDNLVTTIGALTKINEEKIAQEAKKFVEEFAGIEKTKIALIIGGPSKSTDFTIDAAKKLASQAAQIAKNMNAILLVVTSRRTNTNLVEAVKSSLNCDYKFFDWNLVKEKNPYFAILHYADFFIISGDSVSMISECCYFAKPTFIFDEGNIATKKHKIFHEELFSKNFARKLKENMSVLEKFSAGKLEETKRVAKIILSKF